ncbi:MAG TPA: hypothetical protein VFL16_01435 [Steroidobacteraceae bacterium]|nr:hypothetical protein [Steroidobacteraceae bacterium]
MKTRDFLLAGALLLTLAACSKQERVSETANEMAWARAALARNPDIEIVNTDEQAHVFTVRDTRNGSMWKLTPDELVAGPPPPKVAAQPAPAPAPAAAASQASDAVEAPAVPEEAAPQTTVAATRNPAGTPLAEGPGYSIHRGEAADAVPPPAIEGPGYSITREAPTTRSSAPRAEAMAANNVEKRSDPIICQGDRLMHIDGETMEFTGDAVIAENGCDLYISNAKIRAGGVGIIARQARVHIVNSTIGGAVGSYEASNGGEIYVARSTFSGVGRRFDGGVMTDLGGNSYQSH